MMQLRMSLATDNDTPKTAMLAPCEFKEQLAIKMTWVKRFMVNLKALYKLGSMTTTSTGERNAFKFGWSLVKAVLKEIDDCEGNYKKTASDYALAKLAFRHDLLLERV